MKAIVTMETIRNRQRHRRLCHHGNNHDFPFLCNSIRSNALLKDLLKESCAIDNWNVLVSLGRKTASQMHETVFAQQLSKCAHHYEASKLLFPLLWDAVSIEDM